ncbi:ribosomal protein L13e [Thermoproteota archaeon]
MSKQPQVKKKMPSKDNKTSIAKPKEKKQVVSRKEIKKIKTNKILPKKQVPKAIITRPLKHITKNRQGNGFSRSELRSIDINPKKARQLGLKVDLRRKTEWKINVESLKKWFIIPTKKVETVEKIKPITSALNNEK